MQPRRSSLFARQLIRVICAMAIVALASITLAAESIHLPFDVAISEENLPSEELPPTTVASPGAAASQGNANAQPPAIGDSGINAQIQPSAVPTDIAPLEVGSVQPKPQISDYSLEPYIKRARSESPALAASLRLTDQARGQILSGHNADAIQTLTRALSIDARNPYAFFYLGRTWLQRKNYDQAITFFRRAEIGFGRNPDWLGETLSFEGLANEQEGQTAPAVICYQKALRAEPGNLMSRVALTRLGAPIEAPPLAQPVSAPAGSPGGSMLEPPPSGGTLPPPPNSAPPKPAY
jgi:TolA-binding protein